MLSKLYKHEFRVIGKMGGLLLAVSAGVTLLGALYLVSPLFHGIVDSGKGTNIGVYVIGVLLGVFGMLAYAAMLVGVSVGFLIFLGFRFYRSMYSDEGYLTHTLPVKPADLLIAKVVTGGVWLLIMTLAIYLMVGLLAMVGVSQVTDIGVSDLLSGIRNFFSEFSNLLGDLKASWILWILMVLISPFVNVCILFGALTLGQYSWKNRGLMGILAYLGVRFAMSIVSGVLNLALNVISHRSGVGLETGLLLTNNRSLVTLFTSLLFSAVLFIWSIHIVKNRLNLE